MQATPSRIETIEEFLSGQTTATESARRLGLHRVSFWRLVKKYERQGRQGLEHGLKGRRSNRAKPEPFKQSVRVVYEKVYAPSGRSIYSFYREMKGSLLRNVCYATVLSWVQPG